MPNAKLTSIRTAIDKAFTAAGHRAPTSTYAGKNFLPGVCVGAIGVSTGTPAQDIECATAGIEAVEKVVQ